MWNSKGTLEKNGRFRTDRPAEMFKSLDGFWGPQHKPKIVRIYRTSTSVIWFLTWRLRNMDTCKNLINGDSMHLMSKTDTGQWKLARQKWKENLEWQHSWIKSTVLRLLEHLMRKDTSRIPKRMLQGYLPQTDRASELGSWLRLWKFSLHQGWSPRKIW